MDKAILPECYADTLLVHTLVPANSRTGYNHKHGCNEVQREMRDGRMKDEFAVGIIDKDRTDIDYLKEFEVLDEVPGELILWHHKTRPQFMIQICPALERWIINICSQTGIDLRTKDIDTIEKLKAHTKPEGSLKNPILHDLFAEIKAKSEQRSVRKVTTWIQLLRDHNYRVNLNELKNA